MARTLEEINAEIESVKNELNDVHGTETEVYARIVGYYRAVRNWNKGKRDEFNNRKLFSVEGGAFEPASETAADISDTKDIESEETVFSSAASGISNYEFFMRKTCPNCPPVKAYMQDVQYSGTVIDVDTDSGLRAAAEKGVFSAPTVIFYDENGNELGRGHTVEEIKAVLSPVEVVA